MPPDSCSPQNWPENGWQLIPGFLEDDDLGLLCQEADRLWADQDLFAQRGGVPSSPTRSDRLDPVIDISPPFQALAQNAGLVAVASRLLGGEAQLMKDKFIAKPPGAPGYTTHQDAAYWQGIGLDLSRVLTAVVFLDDAPALSGAIECVPGQHDRLLTEPFRIADPQESQVGRFMIIEAKAGDLLLLDAFVPHRSGPNRSEDMRRTVMFTFAVDPRPALYAIYGRHRRGLASDPGSEPYMTRSAGQR